MEWLYLRTHYWSNRVYTDLNALEEAAMSGWRAVCLTPDRIKSICRCEYLPDGSSFMGAVFEADYQP